MLSILLVGLAAFLLADVVFEFCLIHLLRPRHHELWIELGSPKATLRGYVFNSFNARRFVMSRADRDRDDRMFSRYCRIYRAFNVVFTVFYVSAGIVSLGAVVRMLLSH